MGCPYAPSILPAIKVRQLYDFAFYLHLSVQERVKSLTELRKRLVDDGWNGEPMRPGSLSAGPGGRKPGGKGQPEGNSSMVEKERQRLEVMKKRQERDLQQMLMYEQQRKELVDKQQAKVRS